jgi:hypothetical protein
MPGRKPPYWYRLSRAGRFSSDYDDGSPYRDYNDSVYTDHYEDGNYPDSHDDRAAGIVSRPSYVQKIVSLTKDGSRLLLGDEHASSSVFAASPKDHSGAPLDALPKLLSSGWQIASIEPGLSDGEKLVILQQVKR